MQILDADVRIGCTPGVSARENSTRAASNVGSFNERQRRELQVDEDAMQEASRHYAYVPGESKNRYDSFVMVKKR